MSLLYGSLKNPVIWELKYRHLCKIQPTCRLEEIHYEIAKLQVERNEWIEIKFQALYVKLSWIRWGEAYNAIEILDKKQKELEDEIRHLEKGTTPKAQCRAGAASKGPDPPAGRNSGP